MVGAFKAESAAATSARALDLPDLSADPNYATFAKQVENKAELHRLFRSKLSTDTTAHWLARLEEQDLLCAPVQTLAEALASSRRATNDRWCINCDGSGRNGRCDWSVRRSPMNVSAFRLRHAPPTLGEHATGSWAKLGYAPEHRRVADGQGACR